MTKDSNENEFRKVETYALQLVPTDLDGTIKWEVEINKNIQNFSFMLLAGGHGGT